MDWKTFFVELFQAAVWPGLLAWIIWTFRTDIVALAPSLRSMKYKDFSLEFEKEAQRVRDSSKVAVRSESPELAGKRVDETEYYKRLLDVSPVSAVLESWNDLENHMIDFLLANDETFRKEALADVPAEVFLKSQGYLGERDFGLIRSLRDLRNRLAHTENPQISEQSAIHYLMSAALAKVAYDRE